MKKVRIHTDEGWAEAMLPDEPTHGYVVFGKEVATRTLVLEVLGVHGDDDEDAKVHVGELEVYGSSGVAREPWDIDPARVVVRELDAAWSVADRRHRTGEMAAQVTPRHEGQPHEQRSRNRCQREQRIGAADHDERRQKKRKTRRAHGRVGAKTTLGRHEAAGREGLRHIRPRRQRRQVARGLETPARERVGHQRVARGIGSARGIRAVSKADRGNGGRRRDGQYD